VPAAAVIPAPVAYANVVAVKKLVVGFLVRRSWSTRPSASVSTGRTLAILPESGAVLNRSALAIWIIYFEQIRVFKAGNCCEYLSME